MHQSAAPGSEVERAKDEEDAEGDLSVAHVEVERAQVEERAEVLAVLVAQLDERQRPAVDADRERATCAVVITAPWR
jgi:hypothetical protein